MGEHEFELDSGQLYFIEPDESASLIGHVTDTSVECSAEDNDISIPVAGLVDIETAFDWFVKTARIRKKNFNRAIKILEEN